MTIVATEIESIHGSADQKRIVFYKCQDHLGVWHNYGPVITTDPNFNEIDFKTVVTEKVSTQLADIEFNMLISEG